MVRSTVVNRGWALMQSGALLLVAGCLENLDRAPGGSSARPSRTARDKVPCLGHVCQGFPGGVDLQPPSPVRAAFYYNWFPSTGPHRRWTPLRSACTTPPMPVSWPTIWQHLSMAT